MPFDPTRPHPSTKAIKTLVVLALFQTAVTVAIVGNCCPAPANASVGLCFPALKTAMAHKAVPEGRGEGQGAVGMGVDHASVC